MDSDELPVGVEPLLGAVDAAEPVSSQVETLSKSLELVDEAGFAGQAVSDAGAYRSAQLAARAVFVIALRRRTSGASCGCQLLIVVTAERGR